MKRLRTEIHVTVRTFIGDDVGLELIPAGRAPTCEQQVSLAWVEDLPRHGAQAKAAHLSHDNVQAMLGNAKAGISDATFKAITKLKTIP